jgi:large subunit ribosomal protein L18
MNKKISRLRRASKTRARIADLGMARLTVFRSNLHIYAQIIDPSGSMVLASASTLEASVKAELKNIGSNIKAAEVVGQRIAHKAKEAGITDVAFDRSGFKYHGRVKALAEAAREHGLQF